MRSERAAQFVRYVLWQAPGWLVVAVALAWIAMAFGLPTWVVILAAMGNVAKDLLLFTALRTTLRPPESPWHVGAVGEALEPLAPSGLIRVKGELWAARTLGPTVPKGSPVVVRGGRAHAHRHTTTVTGRMQRMPVLASSNVFIVRSSRGW
jgi:membrane protein implicated in regulation of membrane protease activity